MERIVLGQLTAYLQSHTLLPDMLSAYSKGHSTEMAVLWVYSDLVDVVNKRRVLSALLYLWAAFDIVDHNILLQSLQYFWSQWHSAKMVLVLSQRSNWVCSSSSRVNCTSTYGVRSSSRIGRRANPVPSLHGRHKISSLILTIGLYHHCYADDTWLYSSCHQDNRTALNNKMIRCIGTVARWMASNRRS